MERIDVINKSSSYIKSTPYPNPNEFTKWYYKNDEKAAWCGIFIDYIFKHDLVSNMLDSCSNFAYVPTIVKWSKDKGYFNEDYKKAKMGDLVIYNFDLNNKNHYSHVGIIDSLSESTITSIDGNTKNDKYTSNCVAKRTRNKKYIAGVILLPYKEDIMNFKIGDYVYAKEDIKLYTTIEYKESKYTLKKGEKAYVKYIRGNNIALANPETKVYFVSAWTNKLNKLTKEEPSIDYKKLYEDELEKNNQLQNKINEAIKILNS